MKVKYTKPLEWRDLTRFNTMMILRDDLAVNEHVPDIGSWPVQVLQNPWTV